MPQFDLISNLYLLAIFTFLFFISNVNYIIVIIELFIFATVLKVAYKHSEYINAKEAYYDTAFDVQAEWKLKHKLESQL